MRKKNRVRLRDDYATVLAIILFAAFSGFVIFLASRHPAGPATLVIDGGGVTTHFSR